jgi:hypothetical protein
MEKLNDSAGDWQRYVRLPYEKPTAIRVELKPEELLVACGKCPGSSRTPQCDRANSDVKPQQSKGHSIVTTKSS